MKTFLKLITILILCLSALSCRKAAEQYPKFWTWMEDREGLDLDTLFVHMKEAGIDGLMLYVPDQESYAKAAALAKENDVTLYAWIWTLRPRADRDQLLKEHPEWFDYNVKGESLADSRPYLDSYAFLSAALPQVREYVRENIRRVCEMEGIDGICLDYCRIVDRVLPISLSYKYEKVHDGDFFPEYDYGYHPEALKMFESEHGYNPTAQGDPGRDSLWCAFRERMITEVANIAAEVAHSYGKKVTASPFVTSEHAAAMVGQRYSDWNLDLVFPMVYADFYSMEPGFVFDAVSQNMADHNPMTEIYCGLGAELGGSFESLIENMDAAFSAGAKGISLYTIAGLDTKEKRAAFKDYADKMRAGRKVARPDYVPAGEVNLDPFTHPRLMQIVERNIQRVAAGINIHDISTDAWNCLTPDDPAQTYPALDLTEYEKVASSDRVLTYHVQDRVSGKKFEVLFPVYGGLISGWDVREIK